MLASWKAGQELHFLPVAEAKSNLAEGGAVDTCLSDPYLFSKENPSPLPVTLPCANDSYLQNMINLIYIYWYS